jgi:hypothetical protein
MRQVPNCMSAISNLDQNTVENLIQLTLAQAKARGQPIKDLEKRHSELRTKYREFEELLHRAITSGSIPSPSPYFSSSSFLLGSCGIELLFRQLIFLTYQLGSSSPEPGRGRKRTAEAMKIRKKGWEEPVEDAIARAFKAAGPNLPEDKDIIKMVHDEMDRLGIELTAGDEALRKRIRPHRKYAEKAAEFAAKHPGVEMDEDIPI